jgi:hypothetical protein
MNSEHSPSEPGGLCHTCSLQFSSELFLRMMR